LSLRPVSILLRRTALMVCLASSQGFQKNSVSLPS
jgi:hypothetical protein